MQLRGVYTAKTINIYPVFSYFFSSALILTTKNNEFAINLYFVSFFCEQIDLFVTVYTIRRLKRFIFTTIRVIRIVNNSYQTIKKRIKINQSFLDDINIALLIIYYNRNLPIRINICCR
jgi:hypothetical protein